MATETMTTEDRLAKLEKSRTEICYADSPRSYTASEEQIKGSWLRQIQHWISNGINHVLNCFNRFCQWIADRWNGFRAWLSGVRSVSQFSSDFVKALNEGVTNDMTKVDQFKKMGMNLLGMIPMKEVRKAWFEDNEVEQTSAPASTNDLVNAELEKQVRAEAAKVEAQYRAKIKEELRAELRTEQEQVNLSKDAMAALFPA